MTCLHCGHPFDESYHTVCPHCGTPSDPPQVTATILRQKTRPIARPNLGPLLTGNPLFDATIGFIGEIVGLATIVYGIILVASSLDNYVDSPLLMGLGAMATGIATIWYTHTMRLRYPRVAEGWQAGRNTWGRGVDAFLTALLGVAVMVVIFPLGMLVCSIAAVAGPLGIVIVAVAAYMLGLFVRRMSNAHKSFGGTKP